MPSPVVSQLRDGAARRAPSAHGQDLVGLHLPVFGACLQVTALQIAALKRLSGSSTIFLLDRTGSGTAKAVAKALAGRGFGRVFLIKGGFQVGRHTRQSVARP